MDASGTIDAGGVPEEELVKFYLCGLSEAGM
jgi:hypothetical protein